MNAKILPLLAMLLCSCSERTTHEEYWSGGGKQLKVKGQHVWQKDSSGKMAMLYDGWWRYYYPDGQIQLEMRFRGGKLIGTSRSWHENGQLATRGSFDDNDQAHGLAEWWDQKGNLIKSESFVHGTGVNYVFYPDGREKAVMPFVNGKLDGELIRYKEDGAVEQRVLYSKGRVIRLEEGLE